MTDYLDEVAQFAAEYSASALPSAAVERTQLVLADSIAAIVGGSAEPEIGALARQYCSMRTGPAAVLGTGLKTDPGQAALLNGSAGTFLEMDEGNQFCKGHPGIHTIPAVLAAIPSIDTAGIELLAAIAIGYEVGARVGTATRLRPAMHPHGTWGAICAAVGAARLRRFDAAHMRSVLNIASNMCLASSRPTMLEGGTVRNVYAGISGQLGLLSCDLVETGFTGEHDGIANVFGRIVSDRFDTGVMAEQLGHRWEVTRNYFKLHSCCRYNHATLDALEMIIESHPQISGTDNIHEIRVRTYAFAAEMAGQSPQNTLAAKFSIPFAVATRLINGSSGVASFTWDAVRSSDVQRLAKRVFIQEDPDMSARLPEMRPASVRIHMRDGSVFEAATQTNRGDWRDPYSGAELREKYDSLAARRWSREHFDAVHEEIMSLDRSATTASFGEALDRAERAAAVT